MSQLRDDYKLRIKSIQSVIDVEDPLGLLAGGAPSDEYEPEARAIAARIDGCRSVEACLDIVWETFSTFFAESAGRKEEYTDLARQVWEIASKP